MFALFTNIPTPHKVDMFNALNRYLNGDLDVFFFGEGGDKRKGWREHLERANFNYQFMASRRIDLNLPYDPGYLFLPGRVPPMEKYEKVIISGGLSPIELQLVIQARKDGVPYVIWTGAVSLKGGPGIFIPFRYVMRRWIYSGALAVITANTLSKEHALRMSARRVKVAYTSFDIERFDYNRVHEGDFLKILFVGRLVGVKRIPDLLTAISTMRNIHLTIIGDGPLRQDIEKMIRRLNLTDKVDMKGSVSYDKIHEVYREYNLLILPSSMEVHGFVVMEALMSSVPVIVTNGVGAKDFVIPEAIYPVGDIRALRERIEWMRNPENRNRAVEYGKRLIKEKATPEKWAEVFYRVLRDASS